MIIGKVLVLAAFTKTPMRLTFDAVQARCGHQCTTKRHHVNGQRNRERGDVT